MAEIAVGERNDRSIGRSQRRGNKPAESQRHAWRIKEAREETDLFSELRF